MEKETGAIKYDPNQEIVQMRAQWKKADNCKKQWVERWSWFLDEQRELQSEMNKIEQELGATLPVRETEEKPKKPSLKPVPVTSTGVIGWLAAKPDCNLETYTSWINKPPIRLPDAWDYKDFVGQSKPQ
ncbi:uncharacterized protein LOC121738640 isoform X2 [Aricia agestis]|nr:uncharacterized protein LOC121738640 isoform X2 [Aricia agestis]XP_041986769.1 uncharacterized protein LOC121738640 isoform X2 [Aricia agestis]XP_041986770.1 uncharacterized protein LOC121738640 isoform X2 [Aricia agestis]